MDYQSIFEEIHPGFFRQEEIRCLPGEKTFSEMVLELHDAQLPSLVYPSEIVFGKYRGSMSQFFIH